MTLLPYHFGMESSSFDTADENRNTMTVPQSANEPAWEGMFDRLRDYRNREGSCRVPQTYSSDDKLAEWVKLQRRQYKLLFVHGSTGNASLSPSKLRDEKGLTFERVMKLENIGFEWELHDERDLAELAWKTRFQQLRQYKLENGDCLISARYSKNPQLGHWVMTQRRQLNLRKKGKRSSLTEERIKLLDSIGFVWIIREEFSAAWNQRYKELAEYKANYNDCLVPQRYPTNPQLGTWVSTQRIHYKLLQDGKRSSMTNKRIKALEKLGFSWISPSKSGEKRAVGSLPSPEQKEGCIRRGESRISEGFRAHVNINQAQSSLATSVTSVPEDRQPPERNLIQYYEEKEPMKPPERNLIQYYEEKKPREVPRIPTIFSPRTNLPIRKRDCSVLEEGHDKAVQPAFNPLPSPRKRADLRHPQPDQNIHHYPSDISPTTPTYPPIHEGSSHPYLDQRYHNIGRAAIATGQPSDRVVVDPYYGHEQIAMSRHPGLLQGDYAHGGVSGAVRRALDNPLLHSQNDAFNMLQHYQSIVGQTYSTVPSPTIRQSIDGGILQNCGVGPIGTPGYPTGHALQLSLPPLAHVPLIGPRHPAHPLENSGHAGIACMGGVGSLFKCRFCNKACFHEYADLCEHEANCILSYR